MVTLFSTVTLHYFPCLQYTDFCGYITVTHMVIIKSPVVPVVALHPVPWSHYTQFRGRTRARSIVTLQPCLRLCYTHFLAHTVPVFHGDCGGFMCVVLFMCWCFLFRRQKKDVFWSHFSYKLILMHRIFFMLLIMSTFKGWNTNNSVFSCDLKKLTACSDFSCSI